MEFRKLTIEEENIIVHKATEHPYSGSLLYNKKKGLYLCKRCQTPLFRSDDKFNSHCGWPSFDDEIEGAVRRQPDADGSRTEIVCAACGAHLGHVFEGEMMTPKNVRHCVNSLSLEFQPDESEKLQTAWFASGCFWGTEYHFNKANGVVETTVGFMGGHVEHPTYSQVCTGTTGHLETTEVMFDPLQTSYEELVKLFFETHDFTQTDGQGPDIGSQYLSAIFYADDAQKAIAEKYIRILNDKGYKVATALRPAETFWPAEDYHQDYYDHKGTTPYCHIYRAIF
ncbi:bifunctional methionine sulfoxide reductase B/A protein [Microbacter margulisiae]|uniref:Peptide methionine sulfoxide reductase MsrA n=1 Tax=Microbacter margulisiae TaxID=1350067 RepID=A0A7W5DNY0_9PORP|nr:bifunctional methionine sulfoxide reductase B/A protein [Microbacter margulisiae]MBB3186400.1 peptide methionine sulfoxide reductase msrA/msrB [Microbacter margulisiae]